jgi:hypothetical protein
MLKNIQVDYCDLYHDGGSIGLCFSAQGGPGYSWAELQIDLEYWDLAIVFPLDKLDAFFATAFVQQIDLLGKMLDVGLGQLGIHSIRLEANDFNRLSRSLKTNIKFSKEIRLPKN